MSLNVRFYGRVSQPTGYGTASRAYVHALHAAGINVSVVNLDPNQPVHDETIVSLLDRDIIPDFHIVNWFWLPLAVADIALCEHLLREPFYSEETRRRLLGSLQHMKHLASLPKSLKDVIVATAWETDRLPSGWFDVLNSAREVWVPCTHNVAVFERHLDVPIFRLPHAVVPRDQHVRADAMPLRSFPLEESDFVFYSIFVWQDRKSPERIIETFMRAFPANRHPVLVLKIQGDPDPPADLVDRLRSKLRSTARIEILNGVWSHEQIEALTERGNCYVSLHRGEAWCYPLFDAACRGKPVVATAYSGPLDYLNSEYHSLVQYRLVPVKQRTAWYSDQMNWAEPDIECAVRALQYVYQHYEVACRKARYWSRELNMLYSPRAIGALAQRRLTLLKSGTK